MNLIEQIDKANTDNATQFGAVLVGVAQWNKVLEAMRLAFAWKGATERYETTPTTENNRALSYAETDLGAALSRIKGE